VSCPIDQLGSFAEDMSSEEFAERFYTAIKIARLDPYRAVTHNKGIFNGIDAVIIATANDFRAIEACGHAYAARDGQYRSLSDCSVDNGIFHFWLEIPLALGTVGGLTALHPIAKRSLELLDHPSAEELMKVTAATGLAQNFAAVKSLVTTGIQQGHMKMHLANILHHLHATEKESALALEYFKNNKVSFTNVRNFLEAQKCSQ
jgi:hydroxymethylglutaryl-CoA reductase